MKVYRLFILFPSALPLLFCVESVERMWGHVWRRIKVTFSNVRQWWRRRCRMRRWRGRRCSLQQSGKKKYRCSCEDHCLTKGILFQQTLRICKVGILPT